MMPPPPRHLRYALRLAFPTIGIWGQNVISRTTGFFDCHVYLEDGEKKHNAIWHQGDDVKAFITKLVDAWAENDKDA